MANAYDVMRMAKQMGAQRTAEEDWMKFLNAEAEFEERAGLADTARTLFSIFGPDIGGDNIKTKLTGDYNWLDKLKAGAVDFFSGGGLPGFAIKQIGGTILKNLIMGGKKPPKFVSSDLSNPYSGKVTRPYEMKSQIQSDETGRILNQMNQESILTNLLLSFGKDKGTGDMNMADIFGIGGRRR